MRADDARAAGKEGGRYREAPPELEDPKPPRHGTAVKRRAVAALVRGMIADGTLKPGAVVPSYAELARQTGYAVFTCRSGLHDLIAAGTLVPGASPSARLRVATAVPGAGTDPAAMGLALSAALAAHRHAAGLTQPELAGQLDMSLTAVGHAETGRLWQSRDFWRRADAALGSNGHLLRMHDAYQYAANRPDAGTPAPAPAPARPVPVLPESIAITPAGVEITWPDGTKALARPPGCQEPVTPA